jgi:hypothetical protein
VPAATSTRITRKVGREVTLEAEIALLRDRVEELEARLTELERAKERARPAAVTRPWAMANPHWPLFDLRIVTPRLELRYPSDDDLFALAGILAEGIHDPETMPFSEPWTRAEPPELERNGLLFW